MESLKKSNEFARQIISQSEGIHLDFKQSISNQHKIAKNIVAFANTEGGILVVGVSDKRNLIGIDVEEEKFMLSEAMSKFCHPPLPNTSFEVLEIDYWNEEKLPEEKYLLLLHVPKSHEGPHFVVDRAGIKTYYLRDNDKNLPFQNPPLV